MKQRKYRPFIVFLSVCLIWSGYIFFSGFNWQEYAARSMKQSVTAELMPVLYTLKNQDETELSLVLRIVSNMIPCFGYVMSEDQDVVTINMINADETNLENDLSEQEKKLYKGQSDGNAAANGLETNGQENVSQSAIDISAAVTKNKATGTVYNRADLFNNDFLRSHFYTVTSITSLNDSMLRAEEFLNKNLAVAHDASSPQILIFHTHSQEAFADSIEGDVNTSIVGVGSYLTKLLMEKYGYNVIHDTSVYDYVNGTLDRSKAYTYAEEGVQAILDANPSVDVVIDLHRDGVADTTHLITESDGKQMARLMFFNGVSYSNNVGDIGYLNNPNRDDNLAMSLQMQLLGEAYYPGLLRNIYINAYRYCLHMRGKSMLIEAGAQTNTVQEEMNAMEPLADMLDKLLRGEKAY